MQDLCDPSAAFTAGASSYELVRLGIQYARSHVLPNVLMFVAPSSPPG